jgi:hypothetical protein
MKVYRSTADVSGAGSLPPLFAITDSDHGGYVLVVVYTMLILMLLVVATRIYTRWYVVKFFRADDVLLAAAAVRPSPSSCLDPPRYLFSSELISTLY